MKLLGFDHIVLSCHDVPGMVAFYRDIMGCRVGEERPGKWAIWLGPHKISLQDETSKPDLAEATVPGSGNFCLLAETPVIEIADWLTQHGIAILEGPARREGATGPIMSVYFRDPEGNLVEVSNQL